jgi:hypothetical protein
VVAPIITAADRASFRPSAAAPELDHPILDRAVRDALAIYYYPGMWDWGRDVRLPLVIQELDRSVARQGAGGADAAQIRRDGRALLDRYLLWAPPVDRFAPIMVETDFEVPVPDPGRPAFGLVTPEGAAVRYGDRVNLLAADEHDAYWIVHHRLVRGEWVQTADLAADEAALAACWAWEQFYLGTTITGTIWNELRVQPTEPADPAGGPPGGRRRGWPWPRRVTTSDAGPVVRQHEPSGGGRSVSQHRRWQARVTEPARAAPVEQCLGPGFRRTWLRRSRDEVAAAGQRLAVDAAAMIQD